jgi:hypothetical protein
MRFKREGKLDELKTVLADQDMTDAAVVMILGRFYDEAGSVFGSWIDEIMKLFEWLVENMDVIIEVIMKIIALFGETEEAPE